MNPSTGPADNNKKKNKAQAMVIVAVYISVISLIGIYMMVFASQLNNQVIREYNRIRGIYAGEAGVIAAISRMYANIANGAGNLTMPDDPLTVNVTSTAIGAVSRRVRAVVSNWSASSSSGSPGNQIAVTSFFPLPFGEYNDIRASEFIDYDDPNRNNSAVNYKVDPNGTSRFAMILLSSDALLTNGVSATGNMGIAGRIISSSGAYHINLNVNAGSTIRNAMYVHSVRIQNMIVMGAVSPTPVNGGLPIGGKHVYDIAEGMSADACEPGDVVSINTVDDSLLVKTTAAWDTQVAGVISEDPKLYMGPGKGKKPLALAGIVPCKVTAENGPIKRGDLLVSSSVPGHAMAAKPQKVKPGMLVGKALQSLEKGSGKIFILVSKQ